MKVNQVYRGKRKPYPKSMVYLRLTSDFTYTPKTIHRCDVTWKFTRPSRKIMCNYDEIMQQSDVVAFCKARKLSCTILLKSKHVHINAIQARKEKVCNHNSTAT